MLKYNYSGFVLLQVLQQHFPPLFLIINLHFLQFVRLSALYWPRILTSNVALFFLREIAYEIAHEIISLHWKSDFLESSLYLLLLFIFHSLLNSLQSNFHISPSSESTSCWRFQDLPFINDLFSIFILLDLFLLLIVWIAYFS